MPAQTGQFAVNVREWCERAQGKADDILRAVSIEILNRVVIRSPVGNPELWAANKEATEKRRAALGMSRRALEKAFPFKAGKGYTGGRFRGNWQVTLNAPAVGELDRIDPGGGATIADGSAAILPAKFGASVFLVNNLPYAVRLEYGWSTQAPAGMVRITAAEFQGIVDDATRAQP